MFRRLQALSVAAAINIKERIIFFINKIYYEINAYGYPKKAQKTKQLHNFA